MVAAPTAEGLVKVAVGRSRPMGEGFAFPSGHVTAAAAYFGALFYLAGALSPSGLRVAVRVGAMVMIVLVALARIVLRAHWPSDTLAVAGQGTLNHGAHLALVVDDEDPPLAARLADRPGHRLHHDLARRRELDGERRALAELALHVELGVVAGHDAVDDAEAEAGASLPLGGEERIEDALAHVFRHADARIADAAQDVIAVDGRAERHATALGHGVERVEHDVGERLAQLGRITRDDGSRPRLGHDLVVQAPRLGVVLPP